MTQGIDWLALMRLGLFQLRLTPDQFWQLTPAELTLMAGGMPGVNATMTRGRLEQLCAEFPDT